MKATGLRWVNELADFNFTIKYRPGRINTDADSLSRIHEFESYIGTCTEEMLPQTTNAITCAVNLLANGKSNWVTPFAIDPNVFAIDSSNSRNDLRVGVNDLIDAQLSNPVTSRVMHFIEQGEKPLAKELLHESSDVKRLIRDWPKPVVKDSFLKRSVGTISQIVLPNEYHRLSIKALHEDIGYIGTERVFDLAQ